MYFAPRVDMVLFRWIFTVVIVAGTVLVLPSYSERSPPIVALTQCVSTLSRRIFTSSFKCVIFLFFGIWHGWTKNIVLVPVFILAPTPWASRPRSLARAFFHMTLLGPFIRFLYSRDSPVKPITVLMRLSTRWLSSSMRFEMAGLGWFVATWMGVGG